MELPDLTAVVAYYRGLTGAGAAASLAVPRGIIDVVPAARTVLVTFDPGTIRPSEVREWLEAAEPLDDVLSSGREVTIEVSYDGPDLAETAQFLRMSEAEMVKLHTESEWTGAFSGFAPGFVYLVTTHERLGVPRRNTPRTGVPAGSVGLAGEFSGVYPRSSPGGWQLIGTTMAVLWDASKPEPALIRPGDRVRFVEA
ncbi:5-oxoprolinase subunit PxpB [Arthrobacter bambusae]|uniref:5-oxoprolinase subunit PxpB n=1 Tax=Arthrobacter bambusae TaxID=1338426 RepID=UPI00277D9FB8|nr:5-oxoprolinase subunit PxpB [Arthrobacter bambusae]MDQ0030664.1 KipI family sensor histidine kinase inhibitor [Arthrobacter bambusae]MDQ0099049.1 KipI family sensor histidine kinase inhibitor [Arthrobacter bambusae]